MSEPVTALAAVALSTLMTPKTMSSLEIAEFTGKRHNHVLRDIKRILSNTNIDASKFGSVYEGSNGESRPCYHLPCAECLQVVAGYDDKVRWAIIQRWMALEQKNASAPAIDGNALLRIMADAEAANTAKGLLRLILPEHELGSIGPNGKPRLGIRRASFVSAPSRGRDARRFAGGISLLLEPFLPGLQLSSAA